MAITVKHTKVSTIPDAGDASLIEPSDWNADHQLVGTVPVANGGTGAATLTGYVVGNGTSAMTAATTIPSTDVTGLGTMSTQNSNNISVTGGSMSGVTISDYVATATKGVANGVASLDGSGTVPVSQLPAAVLGALSYQGTWNATTNTPTLTSSTGTKGYYYVVSVAGTTNLNGITDWQVGDWAVYNGTAWQKIDNTDAVTSVNGYTGTVVLTAADVSAVPYTGATGAVDLNAKSLTNVSNLGINTTTVPTIKIRAVGDNNSGSRIAMRGYSSDANSSSIRVSKYRGTVASPQAPLSGDSLGKFELAGYGTTSSDSYPQSSLEGVATENWGATARGAKAVVKVTPNTTTTQVTALTIDQDSKATFAGAVNVTGNTLLNQSYDQGTGVLQVAGTSTFNGVVVDKSLNLQGGNNLLAYSQDFTNAAWSTALSSISGAYTAPDGTTTAQLWTSSSAAYASFFQSFAQVVGNTYTASIYAKAGTSNFICLEVRGLTGIVYDYQFTLTGAGTATINPSAVGSPTGTITAVGNGWYRCTVTKVSTKTNPLIIIGQGTSTIGNTVQIWGAQLELGTVASAYTPATTAAITTTNNISVPSGQVITQTGTTSLPAIAIGQTNKGFISNGANGYLSYIDAQTSNSITFGSGISVRQNGFFAFSNSSDSYSGTWDTFLYRDSANTLAQRNTTNAQTFRLYNTYTSTSLGEWLSVDWSTTANTATIATKANGAGVVRTLATGNPLVISTGYTVATLPTGVVGMRAYVTNALAPAYGVAVAGGGAVTIPVFYNGTNWICA